MKPIFRVLGVFSVICAVLILASFTFAVIKKVFVPKGFGAKGEVAVIRVDGVIWSSSEFLRELDELVEDDSVKGIVVRVNSPGGLVAPSQEMFQGLKKADQQKPVVVSMGSVAASGGYYAALGGRKIFANPGTLTASIGVIMEFVNTEQLLKWAKIRRYSLQSGKFKDIGSGHRPMRPDERLLLQKVINNIQFEFKQTVKIQRNLEDEALEDVTDGRILTGRQALEAKLVDEIGTFDDAISVAKQLAELEEDAPVRYPIEDEGLLGKVLFGKAGLLSRAGTGALLPSLARSGWQVMLLAPLAL